MEDVLYINNIYINYCWITYYHFICKM